jgi:hypothetical protein
VNTEKQKRIEQRAYLFWQTEGQPHGRHEEHWHRAARQIEAEETVGKAPKQAIASPERKKSKK